MSKRRRPFVAVETDVAKDESFAVLGDVCGYSRDEALGRIVRLWAWCADRKLQDAPADCPGYAVPAGVIVRFLGPDGVRGILGDGVAEFALGERFRDGLIYLRGTDATVAARRSKIDGAAAGGDARAREVLATGARGSGGRFVAQTTIGQPTHHLPPADAPPAISVDPRSQIPDPEARSPARDPAVQASPPAPLLPASIARAETRRRVIAAAWQIGGDAFRELGREGIEPTAPDAWAGLPPAGTPAMRQLVAVVDGLLVGDEPDAEAALVIIRRRVAVAAAEGRAKRPPTRRFMTPMRIWNEDSFAIASELSPEQAAPMPRDGAIATARAGPRGLAAAEPTRKINTL